VRALTEAATIAFTKSRRRISSPVAEKFTVNRGSEMGRRLTTDKDSEIAFVCNAAAPIFAKKS
jgi:hypothetical protein